MNITGLSTACVNFDYYADYIPIISSVTNLVDLFLKYVVSPRLSEANLKQNHYLAYLDTKKPMRCIYLLIPIIGNIFVAILDIYHKIQADEAEELAQDLWKRKDYSNAFQLYEKAANFGSIKAKYQYGRCLKSGIGLKKTFPNLAEKQFKNAAALGHSKAQEALQSN